MINKKINNFFIKHYLPRWTVVIFDLSIISISFLVTTVLVDNFFSIVFISTLILNIFPVFLIVWIIFKPHLGIIKFFSINDVYRFTIAHLVGSFSLLLFSYFNFFLLSFSLIVIHFFISLSTILFSRITFKYFYLKANSNKKHNKNILIYGTGDIALTTKLLIENTGDRVVGFIDESLLLLNRKIEGLPVFKQNFFFNTFLAKNKVDQLIIADNKNFLNPENKQKIIENCMNNNISINKVSDPSLWINGKLNIDQIKEIKIEDILGRTSIKIDNKKIKDYVAEKVVMITGAAGSIGSEISSQILEFGPSLLILLDRSETPLFDLKNKLNLSSTKTEIKYLINDTTDIDGMTKVFTNHQPQIIFHAAAYKHVPLMEDNPREAIRNNILSLKIMADLSLENNVNKFVMISTDKAVNPTNVMGASKRICEMYIQSLSVKTKNATEFITTRFGNVLGSSGSVIPNFKRQIQSGGPVTVTHKNIIRYFMTIDEACQLVLEAGSIGKGGEIFVFDMGQPVKIYDLAKKMIFLSGFKPQKDIKIKITGLRQGEKLYEELLNTKENTLPTHNKKIMIGQHFSKNHEFINKKIIYMLKSISHQSDEKLVALMKELVPEYISNNSKFEKLDIKKNKN